MIYFLSKQILSVLRENMYKADLSGEETNKISKI